MALIPPFYLDCVTAIGTVAPNGKPRWIASGFFYGHLARNLQGDQREYLVYLITNRHVFEGMNSCLVRCNPRGEEPAHEFWLDLVDQNRRPLWLMSPNTDIDIAVVPLDFKMLLDQGMQVHFFASDQHVADIGKMNELGITEGDFAYVLGFPLGIIGGNRNFVIVRSGTIARIRDTLTKANNEFIVDAFVFPGNSGGPIVTKPEITAIAGTKSQRTSLLIGVVKSYVPYQDIATSAQTGRPRVIFEENSGLAAAHPIDFVQEAVMEHAAKFIGPPGEAHRIDSDREPG